MSADENKKTEVKVIYHSIGHTVLPNAIGFDLDETIGSFSDFHSIWARLRDKVKTQPTFNALMGLYPEFLRPGILSILRYIQTKQRGGHCLPIYIYTNNQCKEIDWIDKLICYLEFCITGKHDTPEHIFAKPICAFEINGKRIEKNRTTNEKTYSDFVRCSMISTSHQICFIDDLYHAKMKNHRVYYIQPPPYKHPLTYREVMDRFLSSPLFNTLYPDRTPVEFRLYRPSLFSDAEDSSPTQRHIIDVMYLEEERKVTNKIMYYIREFFLVSMRRTLTRKRKNKIGNFSRKKRS